MKRTGNIWMGMAFAMGVGIGLSSAAAEVPKPYFDTYEQELTVRFRNSSAAHKAQLAMLPLPEGKKLAVTCRWDDNGYVANPKVATMTKAIGVKGTFFLNGINGDRDIPRYREMGESCLAAGHSLGTHGLVHSPASVNNPNYLAEEFLRNRILIERTFNTAVNSHAWAFMDSGGNYFMDSGHALVAEVMFRSGLICSAQDFGVSVRNKGLCPRIGTTYNNEKDKLSPETLTKRVENISKVDPSVYIMPIHAQWYKDFDSEVAQAESVAGNPDYWYCTVNQYAAYRNQFTRTRIESELSGTTLKVRLTRPVLRDLNDTTPLTLQIEGCDADQVEAVRVSGAEVTPLADGEFYRFLLPHDADQALPTQIGAVFNEENETDILKDETFSALQGVLRLEGTALHWVLENTSSSALGHLRLAFRLPYAYTNGVQTIAMKTLAAGEKAEGILPLEAWTDDYRFHCGVPFFVLQVDAFREDTPRIPIRFYLTTSGPETPLSPAYPKGNFGTLGPIPEEEWTEDLLTHLFDQPGTPLVLSNGTELAFSMQEPNPITMENVPNHEQIVDGHARYWMADMVLTTGTMMWLGEPLYGYWLLQSQITSPEAQEVYLLGDDSVQQVFLNGEALVKDESEEGWGWQPIKRNRYLCPLNTGANDFFVVAKAGKGNAFQSKQGTMIYFTQDKQNQTPVKGLTFRAPSSQHVQ